MSLKKIITYPRLIIDNTFLRKINDLLEKQKKLIAGKIHLQSEAKEITKLLQQYEDNIIKIENKLNQYRRKQHGQRDIKQTGNTRPGRNKAKDNNESPL